MRRHICEKNMAMEGVKPLKQQFSYFWLDTLKHRTREELINLGLRSLDNGLYLFPGDWYCQIPEGYIVKDVLGHTKPFTHSEYSDNTNLGVLSFGIVVEDNVTNAKKTYLELLEKSDGLTNQLAEEVLQNKELCAQLKVLEGKISIMKKRIQEAVA